MAFIYYILARSRQKNKRITTLQTKLLATSIYTIFIFLSYPNEPDLSFVKKKIVTALAIHPVQYSFKYFHDDLSFVTKDS